MRIIKTALFILIVGCSTSTPPVVHPGDVTLTNAEEEVEPVACMVIEVDYDITLTQIAPTHSGLINLIKIAGYEPTPRENGKVKKNICWFNIKPPQGGQNVKRKIEAGNNFLVADLWELRALGIKKPAEIWKVLGSVWLVGLGSPWGSPLGHDNAPFLIVTENKYSLEMTVVEDESRTYPEWFLAIRK